MKGVEMQTMRWRDDSQTTTDEQSFGKDGGVTVRLEGYENDDGEMSENQIALLPRKGSSDHMEEGDATVMLAAIAEGDRSASEKLLVLVYDELRRLAAS